MNIFEYMKKIEGQAVQHAWSVRKLINSPSVQKTLLQCRRSAELAHRLQKEVTARGD